MKDHHRAKYFLEGLTMGEWWDAVEGERLATERRGLSCEVRMNPEHHWYDGYFDAPTKNYLCCLTHGRSEVTFVHSLENIAFSVQKSSPIRLDGDWLIVEGHGIKFFDVPPSFENGSMSPK